MQAELPDEPNRTLSYMCGGGRGRTRYSVATQTTCLFSVQIRNAQLIASSSTSLAVTDHDLIIIPALSPPFPTPMLLLIATYRLQENGDDPALALGRCEGGQ